MKPKPRSKLAALSRALTLWLALPLATLVATRLIWGWQAAHHLAAVRAALQAQGVRLTSAAQPIPDSQNAVAALIQAESAIHLTPADADLLMNGDFADSAFADITWTDAQKPDVHRILAAQAPVFDWMKQASQRPAAYWAVSTGAPQYMPNHPLFNVHPLAELLADAALIAHEDHRETDCLNDLQLLLALARIADGDTAQWGHLMACRLRSLDCALIERLEPTLTLPTQTAAPARQLLIALREITDDHDAKALAYENDIGRFELPPDPTIQPFWRWWFQPLSENDLARVLEGRDREIPSVRADNWRDADALVPRSRQDPDSSMQEVVLRDSYDQTGTSWNYSRSHFQACADCAAAQILLAARLYASDHGQSPASPEMLVPAYLPQLPIDPFAPHHLPMHYRLDPDGPTVWSVNVNGIDDGGQVRLNYDGRRERYAGRPESGPPDLTYGAAWRNAAAKPPASTLPASSATAVPSAPRPPVP